jgi:VWFA-related protein
MSTRLLRAVSAGVVLVPLSLGSLRAQQRPAPKPSPSPQVTTPSFPAQVDQVNVDAVVVDRNNKPISNLRMEDFIVLEDGRPQQLVSFEQIQLPDKVTEAPPPRPRVATNVGTEVRAGRTFAVVFDDIHLAPAQAHRAKGAVAEFLKSGVREGDYVSLIATSGSAWWGTRMEAGREELLAVLKRLDGRYIPDMSPERMSDYEAMRIHVFHDTQVSERVRRRFETYGVTQRMQSEEDRRMMSGEVDPYVSGRASDVYFQAVTRNRITLEILERALNSLSTSKGRKSLILVSEGFIYDPNLDEFKRVKEASRRANTPVYFLDTRGLGGMSVYATAQFGPPIAEQDIGAGFMESIEASEGAESIAEDTGGFTVKNTNDLGKGIARIANENRVYYLLGYNPSNTARDGRWRKIEVKVAGGKGLQVRARKGYFAPLEGGKTAFEKKPGGPDPVFQTALDSPYELEDVPIRLTSYVFDEALLGRASVVVAADVDLRSFAFDEQEGKFVDTLELLMIVAHRESGEFFRYDQKVDMKLLPQTRERFGRSWFPLVRDFELAPGGYMSKLVVRDKNSGRVGTVIHHFEVPELTEFRVSTPVLTDTVQKTDNPDEKHPRPQLLARRTFTPGPDVRLFCSFEVYGAAKEKQYGMPRVSAGYIIRRTSDGALFRAEAPTQIKPTSLGKLSRLLGMGFEDVPPGDYEFILTVKDEISGKLLEIKEPFTVTSPAEG